MKNESVYESLLSEISKLPVIDTHEHLPAFEENRCSDDNDVLSEYLMHYLKCDLISAGLKQEDYQKVIDTSRNIVERWNIVEPFWEVSRFTGYGRTLDISVKGIYGIDGINKNTIEELNTNFLENKKPVHYKKVLKDLCNIETSLLDDWTYHDKKESEFFKYIWQPQKFITPFSIEEHVKSLDDWIAALEKELDFILKLYDVKVMKTAIAYRRTLRFEKVEYSRAKSLFDEALKKWESNNNKPDACLTFPTELQDFMMHYILKLANSRNLTFQIHTGLLEGNGNTLSNSDPSLLNNLFLEYPDVDFDIFHIGYPYQGVACALSKMFPNVTIDMCWAHIISPTACVTALSDFLDAIPYNKISAFGGDYLFVDGIYGHLQISRQNVSRTLAGKVERDVFDIDKALDIAKALYYDNPKRIFKL
ncbi:MAG: amidohydrolase family protein [Saccharofermentanales bacterium]